MTTAPIGFSLRAALAAVVLLAAGCGTGHPKPARPNLSSRLSIMATQTNRTVAPATTTAPSTALRMPSTLWMPTNHTPAVTPPVGTPPPPATGVVGRTSPYRLRAGDPVVVNLRDILPRDETIEDIIDETGAINLPLIGRVVAAGRTTSELENEVQKRYIDEQYFKKITVNVVMPSQSYYVRGEVKAPGRFPLVTGVTMMQAIATAGGYTDWADPKKVKVMRGDKVMEYNARDLEKLPEKDPDVEPGDVIVVPRTMY
jgi:polysaccharide export outer membrane protein